MTVQGKPDRCPKCPHNLDVHDPDGCSIILCPCTSPVPAASNVSAPNPRQVVTDAIREQEPKPTQLLALLSSQLSYGKIQDILSELLELGTVELGSDRRLRMVLRERPVPAAAPNFRTITDPESGERIPIKNNAIEAAPTHDSTHFCDKHPGWRYPCVQCAKPSAPQAESVNEIWDIRHPAAESDQAAINRRMVDEHDSCVCTPGSPCKYHAESVPRPRISDLEAAMDEGKHIDMQPDGKVFVSDYPTRPTIDVLLSQIDAESVPACGGPGNGHIGGEGCADCRESVPSGKEMELPEDIVAEMSYKDSQITALQAQTAALAAERDKVQAELNETIEDAVCGTKRILELERSNSLLRERLTAAEGEP